MNQNLTITLPDHVMMREVGGESILLDLETEKYFGLDEVGTDVVTRMSSGSTLGETIAELLQIYEVDEETLASVDARAFEVAFA